MTQVSKISLNYANPSLELVSGIIGSGDSLIGTIQNYWIIPVFFLLGVCGIMWIYASLCAPGPREI